MDDNFIDTVKVSLDNSKTCWRYQNFSSREEDVHEHSPFIYGQSVKGGKRFDEMGGHFLGGFQGEFDEWEFSLGEIF